MEDRKISGNIVSAAMKVHSALGPGLFESAYEACMLIELRRRGFHVESQVSMPIMFEGERIDLGYRVDMLVEQQVVVELKVVSKRLPIHESQLLAYMKLGGFRVGLLLNFHEMRMKDGIFRMVN